MTRFVWYFLLLYSPLCHHQGSPVTPCGDCGYRCKRRQSREPWCYYTNLSHSLVWGTEQPGSVALLTSDEVDLQNATVGIYVKEFPPVTFSESPTSTASDLPRKHAISNKRRPAISNPPATSPTGIKLPVPTVPAPLRIRKQTPPTPRPPYTMRVPRILICSLGNPAPYHTTRHSAGNILLKVLGTHLNFPTLAKNKSVPAGLVSTGSDAGFPTYTLWQSGSMMNASGTAVLKAWKAFSQSQNSPDVITSLVILHDELEGSIGDLKARRGESSPKGHNGIKSVQSSLKSAGLLATMGDRFVKIGIGIGRPASRERDEVSAWVLGQLTGPERQKIEGSVEKLHSMLQGEAARLEQL